MDSESTTAISFHNPVDEIADEAFQLLNAIASEEGGELEEVSRNPLATINAARDSTVVTDSAPSVPASRKIQNKTMHRTPSQEQAHLAKEICQHLLVKNVNVCLTGPIASGKSEVVNRVKKILDADPKSRGSVAVLSVSLRQVRSLGLSAEAADTVSHFFRTTEEISATGNGARIGVVPTLDSIKNTSEEKNILQLKYLLLDNVSDICPSLFVQLETLVRTVKGSKELFGGVKLLATANFYTTYHPWFIDNADLVFNQKIFLDLFDVYLKVENEFGSLRDELSRKLYTNIYPSPGRTVNFDGATAIIESLVTRIVDPSTYELLACTLLDVHWLGTAANMESLTPVYRTNLGHFFNDNFVILVRSKNQASTLNSKFVRVHAKLFTSNVSSTYCTIDNETTVTTPVHDLIFYDASEVPDHITLHAGNRVALIAQVQVPGKTTIYSGRMGSVTKLLKDSVEICFDETGSGQQSITIVVNRVSLLVRTDEGRFVQRIALPVTIAYSRTVNNVRSLLLSPRLRVFVYCGSQIWTSAALLTVFATVTKLTQVSLFCFDIRDCVRLLTLRSEVTEFLTVAHSLKTIMDNRLPNKRGIGGAVKRGIPSLGKDVLVLNIVTKLLYRVHDPNITDEGAIHVCQILQMDTLELPEVLGPVCKFHFTMFAALAMP